MISMNKSYCMIHLSCKPYESYTMSCFQYLFKNSGLTMTYRLNSDPINNAKIIIAAGQSQEFSHFLHSRIFILTELSKITLK